MVTRDHYAVKSLSGGECRSFSMEAKEEKRSKCFLHSRARVTLFLPSLSLLPKKTHHKVAISTSAEQ